MTENENDSGRRISLIILVVGIQKFAIWTGWYSVRWLPTMIIQRVMAASASTQCFNWYFVTN